MTLAIALTFNIVLMAALLGGLAYTMSLSRKLTPHAPGVAARPRSAARRSAGAPRPAATPIFLAA